MHEDILTSREDIDKYIQRVNVTPKVFNIDQNTLVLQWLKLYSVSKNKFKIANDGRQCLTEAELTEAGLTEAGFAEASSAM